MIDFFIIINRKHQFMSIRFAAENTYVYFIITELMIANTET